METIKVKHGNKETLINKVDQDLIDGKRRPSSEEEREGLAVYQDYIGRGYTVVKEETKKPAAKEEEKTADEKKSSDKKESK